jgi:hypothetical protein
MASRKGSGFADNAIPGMALASFEMQRTLIQLLVIQKTVPKALMIELIDQSIQRIERMQLEMEAKGNDELTGPARAARLHLEVLLLGVRRAPD